MTASIKAMAREAGTSAATAEAAMRVGFADIQRGRLVFINDKMGEMLIEFAALVRAQALEEAAKRLDGLTVGRNELIGPAGRYAKGSAMDAAMRQCAAAIRALPPSE